MLDKTLLDAVENLLKWADDLRYFTDYGHDLAPVFKELKAAYEAYQNTHESK